MSETADLFKAALERVADGDLTGYLDLCSDDVEFEFPFAPPGRPERLRGRENLRLYLQPMASHVSAVEISSLVVYETDVADTIVAEMTVDRRSPEREGPRSMRYVVIVRAVGGRIVSYRDYWNPLALNYRAAAAGAL